MKLSLLSTLALATLLTAPLALACHADASGAENCRLLGELACRLELTLSPALLFCNASFCRYDVDCFGTISGTIASAEVVCQGVTEPVPCGTGGCGFSVDGPVIDVPRGASLTVTATGIGHGLVVDSTDLIVLTATICG